MKLGYKFSWSEIDLLMDNWQKLAEDNQGQSKTIVIGDGTYRRFELKIPFSDGEIMFITDEHKPLKIKYSFSKRLGFEFLIYPEDFMDRISKLFGNKEIVTGDKLFDDKYFIKGNNELLLKSILTSSLRNYLLENSVSNFKLEKVDDLEVLELNIMINELEYSSMNRVLNLFKNAINVVQAER
jgi:hypothetical protein